MILFSRIQHNPKIVDTFDMIEVNHRCNEYGTPSMDQIICWDWARHESRFLCQYWKDMGSSAREKTKEGEKKWMKERRAKADKIKDWVLRKDFLNKTHYAGDFVGGKYWPYKNWRSGYYEIKYENRIIRAKIFRQTWTNYDPEVEDRKKFPVDLRRNLTKPLKVK